MRQWQDLAIQPGDGRVGAEIFHVAATSSVLQECHRNGTDAFICDEIIHDGSQPDALEIIRSIIDNQQREWSLCRRLIEIDIAFAIILKPPGVHAVTRQYASGNVRAAYGKWRWHALRHIEKVVACPHSIADAASIPRVEELFLRDRILERILNIGIAGNCQGTGPDRLNRSR